MIISGEDYWAMAKASCTIGDLQFRCHGRLSNIIAKIVTLDDPYYMNLSHGTYAATLFYAPGAHQ